MSLHFEVRSTASVPVVAREKQDHGQRAYLSGQAAEETVAERYRLAGCRIEKRRWRGHSGEIDLIVRDGNAFVFVEVKKARDFDTAATRLSRRQAQRIHLAAAEYLASTPLGQLSEVRFDLALCNSVGDVEIREGAFSYF